MKPKLALIVGALFFAGLQPANATRWVYALELHDISTLYMPFEAKNTNCALVADSSSYLYRVCLGDYVGKNFGIVDRIEKDKIIVKEALVDPKGEWVEVTATIKRKTHEKP